MAKREIPWHIEIKRYLTEPRRPSEILKHFKKLVKPVMYKNLKNLIKWGEVRKIEDGRNVFYVVASYEPMTDIVKEEMIRLKRKKEYEKPLKKITYQDILRSEELLKEVAIRLGKDPSDEDFRKKYFNALSFIKKELDKAESSILGEKEFEGDKELLSEKEAKEIGNIFSDSLQEIQNLVKKTRKKSKRRDLHPRKNSPRAHVKKWI
jgi:hypothetical protein